MKTIIFKSEKNAKVYEIRSAIDKGCYKAGDFLRRVKTDNIENCLNYGETFKEVIEN